MSEPEFKRRRTGVLSTGYFNAIGLPGVQAVDGEGNDIENPENRSRINFNGDVSQLFFPSGLLTIDGDNNLSLNGIDEEGTSFSRIIGKLTPAAVDSTSSLSVNTITVGGRVYVHSGPDASYQRGMVSFDGGVGFSVEMSRGGGESEMYEHGIVPVHGFNFDNWAMRFIVSKGGVGVNGFIFQNTDNELLASIRSTDGYAFFKDMTTGTITKSGGTFNIPHPHPSKSDTHRLVHSFTESPKADLLYSGMAVLGEGGSVEVDIDDEAGMTRGTFELLCCRTRRHCSNQTGFDVVKCSLTGSKLYINCVNTDSRDEVYWQVIGERCDETVKSLHITGDDGRVIVEPAIENLMPSGSIDGDDGEMD